MNCHTLAKSCVGCTISFDPEQETRNQNHPCPYIFLVQAALCAPSVVALQCVAGHCYYQLSVFFSLFLFRLLLLTHFGNLLCAKKADFSEFFFCFLRPAFGDGRLGHPYQECSKFIFKMIPKKCFAYRTSKCLEYSNI